MWAVAVLTVAAPRALFPVSPVSFDAPRALLAGGCPWAEAVADFNGDGKPDLAVTSSCSEDDTVSILLGNGNGTFRPAVNYRVGNTAFALVVGDFNGDGKLDLAVANEYSDSISILLGNGDGTFRPALNSGVHQPLALAVGDFNGDGKLDLAVASYGPVSILLGNGDGAFRAAVTYPVSGAAYAVAVGDFNGDGKADLAVAGYGSKNVSILVGKGDGTLQPAVYYAIGSEPSSLAVGDFNGDGKADLVVTDSAISILLGNGDGTFQPPVNYAVGSEAITYWPSGEVIVGDLTGNGKLDLAVAVANGVSILLGNGDGTFESAANYNSGGSPESLAVGDFNGDGKPDLAVVDLSGGIVAIMLGNGQGEFVHPATYPGFDKAGDCCYAIAVGDFNGDGKPDLVTADEGFAAVSVRLGEGNGAFLPRKAFSVGYRPVAVAVGDLNGDGKLDVAVAGGPDADNISVLLGNGDGTLQPAVHYASGGSTPTSVAVGDFNGDGKLDLAVANQSSSSNSVSILLGNGDGTFQPAAMYSAPSVPASVAIGDFNGDGKLDLAVAVANGASILMGNGDGTFQPAVNYTTGAPAIIDGPAALFVAVGDFNGDGKLDLAVANEGSNGPGEVYFVAILLGHGDGTFQPAATIYPLTEALSIAVADFNGDGRLDLALVNYNGAAILLGNGDGTFQPPSMYASGSAATSLAVGDFNLDGKPDLAVANYGSDSIAILTNTTP
jgi:hypothetical protein